MRKTALFLVIILVISIPLSVYAEPRALLIDPTLRFNGNTATCEVTIIGNNTSEHIEVTMDLMCGTYCVNSWSSSGYGYVHMLKTATVTTGRPYQLIAKVKVNGVSSTPVSVSGTC